MAWDEEPSSGPLWWSEEDDDSEGTWSLSVADTNEPQSPCPGSLKMRPWYDNLAYLKVVAACSIGGSARRHLLCLTGGSGIGDGAIGIYDNEVQSILHGCQTDNGLITISFIYNCYFPFQVKATCFPHSFAALTVDSPAAAAAAMIRYIEELRAPSNIYTCMCAE